AASGAVITDPASQQPTPPPIAPPTVTPQQVITPPPEKDKPKPEPHPVEHPRPREPKEQKQPKESKEPKEAKDTGAPKALGMLMVNTPGEPDTKVIVDGKNTGRVTPIPPGDPLKLPVGNHTVTLVFKDGTKRNVPVTIPVNELYKLIERK